MNVKPKLVTFDLLDHEGKVLFENKSADSISTLRAGIKGKTSIKVHQPKSCKTS
jgi:hypothetical protein